jgi:predicted RNA-binding Zn-ribbon protein involved in translation (DUF1610 family)
VSGSEGRFPKSLLEFQRRFATESACSEDLFERRWPEGFVCPGCGEGRAWLLKTKAFTYECADCGRQTSVTAGTIMHARKLPLTMWFWAAFLMATHSNGISALQLQSQLSLGMVRRTMPIQGVLGTAGRRRGEEPMDQLGLASRGSRSRLLCDARHLKWRPRVLSCLARPTGFCLQGHGAALPSCAPLGRADAAFIAVFGCPTAAVRPEKPP